MDNKGKNSDSQKGLSLLNKAYSLSLNGIPKVSESIEELVTPYIKNAETREEAIDNFVKNQVIKCSTAGFLTGLGGLITLPVTLPADLIGSTYIEMRMIAGIAYIRGYNLYDDQVKTAVFLCIAGNAMADVMKQVGIKVVEKLVIKKLLPKLTNDLIVKINKAVGYRLVAEGGSKVLIRTSKIIPLIGGVIGGGWNYFEINAYAKYAKAMFDENCD